MSFRLVALSLFASLALSTVALAQPPNDGGEIGPAANMTDAEARAAEALAADEPADPATPSPPATPLIARGKNLLELQLQGGLLMFPIGFMAIVVVAFGIERFLGLRRRKILPPELIEELGELARQPGGLEPRQAYRVCQQHPSAAASVVQSTLLKVGRPHAEVEHTVQQASDREAAKLYANVRPIVLATAVSPLLGLLGTVQGMIEAFALTASGTIVGSNRAEQLAGGIYVALVTTFAGLCVAIPGAILAHYFEGRIQKRFRDIDEMLQGILPQLERYEGKLRVNHPDRDERPAEEARPRPVRT